VGGCVCGAGVFGEGGGVDVSISLLIGVIHIAPPPSPSSRPPVSSHGPFVLFSTNQRSRQLLSQFKMLIRGFAGGLG